MSNGFYYHTNKRVGLVSAKAIDVYNNIIN